MDYFNCKVRLGGSLHNEVRKTAISAPEVIVLRHIHGGESVFDFEPVDLKRSEVLTQEEIRENMCREYGDDRIAALFGESYMPLPETAPGTIPRAVRAARRRGDTGAAEPDVPKSPEAPAMPGIPGVAEAINALA